MLVVIESLAVLFVSALLGAVLVAVLVVVCLIFWFDTRLSVLCLPARLLDGVQ